VVTPFISVHVLGGFATIPPGKYKASDEVNSGTSKQLYVVKGK
jgi:hypothetical protein